MNIHNKSKYKHIYKNKNHAITKDIKYAPKLFNKDVNEYKKDVLFSIVYNKNDILYRKTLIDKSTVNKSNLLITPISNDWNNNFIYRKKTSIYPLQENNIITYKSITDKFIYYYILYTNNVYKHVIYTHNYHNVYKYVIYTNNYHNIYKYVIYTNNYHNVYKHVIYIKP